MKVRTYSKKLTSKVIVRRSTITKLSMHGKMKNKPGLKIVKILLILNIWRQFTYAKKNYMKPFSSTGENTTESKNNSTLILLHNFHTTA
jgi:hypothetical protein